MLSLVPVVTAQRNLVRRTKIVHQLSVPVTTDPSLLMIKVDDMQVYLRSKSLLLHLSHEVEERHRIAATADADNGDTRGKISL